MEIDKELFGINLLPAEYLMPSKYDLYNFGITKVKLGGSQETKGHKHFRIFLMSYKYHAIFISEIKNKITITLRIKVTN